MSFRESYTSYVARLAEKVGIARTALEGIGGEDSVPVAERIALVAVARALAPLIGEADERCGVWLTGIEPSLSKFVGETLLKDEGSPAVEVKKPAYALAACNLRGRVLSGARQSVYLAPRRRLASFDAGSNELFLYTYLPPFYAGLVPIYFELFNRAATFNECVLDSATLGSAVSVRFTDSDARAFQIAGTDDLAELTIGQALWKTLLRDQSDGELLRLLWDEAWSAMCTQLRLKPREAPDGPHHLATATSLWFSAAIQALTRQRGAARLRSARVNAAAELAQDSSDTEAVLRAVEQFFPDDSKSLGPFGTVDKLLSMLQGIMLLAPWAEVAGVPLPVITYRVTVGAGPAAYRNGLTFILPDNDPATFEQVRAGMPAEVGALTDLVRTIGGLVQAAHDRYAREYGQRPGSASSASQQLNSDQELPPHVNSRDSLKTKWLELQRRDASFRQFHSAIAGAIQTTEKLAGFRHEGAPTRFTIVVGVPEFLKHIDSVLSQEADWLVPGGQDGSTLSVEDWVGCYKSHFSLFRMDRVAAYLDPYQMPRGHGISKIVLLARSSSDDCPSGGFALMQAAQEWARSASRVPGSVADEGAAVQYPWAVSVTTDERGTVRVFSRGREVLRRLPSSGSDDGAWQWGLDLEDGRPRAADRLELAIANGLGAVRDDPLVKELSSVLIDISETPGEGALVVLDRGGPRVPPPLTSLIPDVIEMKWARSRDARFVQADFLRCLAALDGALVIRRTDQANFEVASRHYVSPHHDGGLSNAAEIREQLQHLLKEEVVKADDAWGKGLLELIHDLPTMGARHRSALLLAWYCDDLSVITVSADGPIRVFEKRVVDQTEKALRVERVL